MVFSFLVSFLTGPFPGSAVFIGLALLCSWYGKGIEEGYLILRPGTAPVDQLRGGSGYGNSRICRGSWQLGMKTSTMKFFPKDFV